ncbi:MAG: tetratricopeptide repeat protein [Desulfatiglandaceae bacterium]
MSMKNHRMTAVAAVAAFLVLAHFVPCFAGTFLEMQPGVSARADADSALGPPIQEVAPGIRYDYKPQLDSRRLSIQFDKNTGVIESIDIYSEDPYTKKQYQEWLQLDQSDMRIDDENGNRVEYYRSAGVALHFSGLEDTSPVAFFSHYDVMNSKFYTRTGPPAENPEIYYVSQSDKAIEAKEWLQAKDLLEEGLRKFPDSSDLWHNRGLYYFRSKAEPRDVRRRETKRSVERAYRLNPSGRNAAEMGWIRKELGKDCYSALPYFEEAERKGYAEKEKSLLYWIGWCYEMIEDIPRARNYYQRFVTAAPEDEKAEDARDRLRWIK